MTVLELDIRDAIQNKDETKLDSFITELLLKQDLSGYVDLLNQLLLVPFHYHHQSVTKALQNIKSQSSVYFIGKVLETNFSYLEYSGSDSDAIAKWFSWALFSIGNQDAIDLMKKYASSTDEGIRNEMRYRLSKLK
jgi:hypothetical protein